MYKDLSTTVKDGMARLPKDIADGTVEALDKHYDLRPTYVCQGISSATEDKKHIILLDFDNTLIHSDKWYNLVKRLQKEYGHSDYFVVQGSKKQHFHLYCPTKVGYLEYLKVLDKFERCGADKNFKYPLIHWKKKGTVLRYAGKDELKYKMIVKSVTPNKRQMSYGHLQYLRVAFGIVIDQYTNHDGSRDYGVEIQEYPTHKA
jgi:hypothetical protein